MSLGATPASQGSCHPAQGPGPHSHPHGHQPLSQLPMVGDAGSGSQGLSQPSQKSWGHQGSPSIRHLSGDRGMPSPGWNRWAKIFHRVKGSHIFQRMCGPPELTVGTGYMWHAHNEISHRPQSSGLICQLQHAWQHRQSHITLFWRNLWTEQEWHSYFLVLCIGDMTES